MGYFQKAVAACAMASLCLSVLAAENPKAKKQQFRIDYSKAQQVEITEQMRVNFAKFIEGRRALLAKSVPCTYQTGGICVLDIPVILVADPANASNIYCVAVFPEEYSLPGTPTTDEKTIVWRLVPPSPLPAGATFTFFDKKDLGIIVLSDNSSQLKGGSLGDGTVTPPDATKYRFVNKHKVKSKAVYLPIVVRTDNAGTASQKVSMCGTPDPTIAND
jgi:hypothetical protein